LRAIHHAHLVVCLVQPHPTRVPPHYLAGLLAVATSDRHQPVLATVIVERDDLELLVRLVCPFLGPWQWFALPAALLPLGLDLLPAFLFLGVSHHWHHDSIRAEVNACLVRFLAVFVQSGAFAAVPINGQATGLGGRLDGLAL